jgi:hypothetical protein
MFNTPTSIQQLAEYLEVSHEKARYLIRDMVIKGSLKKITPEGIKPEFYISL